MDGLFENNRNVFSCFKFSLASKREVEIDKEFTQKLEKYTQKLKQQA